MSAQVESVIVTNAGRMDRSGAINELAAALAKAQAMIKPAAKDSDNPYFHSKYADLASIDKACREALTANGLAIVQRPVGDGNGVLRDYTDNEGEVHTAVASTIGIVTTLLHDSGQWIEGTILIKHPNATPQAIGSALTYLRRYSLAAMVGVVADDDDGNAAQASARTRARAAQPANDNGSARRAGSPPAPDGKNQAPASSAVVGRSTPRQWSEYDALRESMHVTEEAGLARVSALMGRGLRTVGDLSSEEMERVLEKMREAAGGGGR